MPKLLHARSIQNERKKIPQFKQVRKTLYDKYTPEVKMEISYINKETNEVTVVKDTVTPKSRFPPHLYEKINEVATVKVSVTVVHYFRHFILRATITHITHIPFI